MCTILFSNDPLISKPKFLAALDEMKHRGPDIPGCYENIDGIQMGHSRLKILDLDNRSNQPFHSASQKYTIIFNGEIYNYRELSKKYNIQAKTTGDTEVLIELYALLGPKMLHELNGMFALVILDKQTKEIFIARDRLGIKPVYFYRRKQYITIASEVAPLVFLRGKNDFDEIGIRQYRKLRTFFNGRTIYQGIEMFPAAHYVTGDKMTRYWDMPETEQAPPDDEEIRHLLKSAVDYRCIADVQIGSFLSGGLDSTIVAGLAEKPDTWTVGFKNHNEFEWGRMAAARFQSHHSEVLIDEKEFIELARFMIHKRKEPLSVPNEVLLYKMSLQVKTRNTIILSGEGADELFFGYDRIFRWAAQGRWDIKEFDRCYAYGSHDDPEIIEDALAPFMKYKKPVDIVARFFQIAHLHGLLRRLDNSTMLCSVEGRVPFVDHRLVERMAGVRFEYRMQDGVIKAPLKRAYKHLVPVEIIERPKIGFPVPLESVFGESVAGSPMDAWLDFNLKELGIKD